MKNETFNVVDLDRHRLHYGHRQRDRRAMDAVAVAIILPTYNERANIGILLANLISEFPKSRILVVDDSSPDKTADIVQRIAGFNPNIALLSRSHKQGLGTAYRAGIKEALRRWNPKRIVLMDADGSHSVDDLHDLLTARADIVVGSRYCLGGHIEGWSWWRRALSRCGNLYARRLVGINVHDITSGFMCVSKAWALALEDTCASTGYAFLMELKFTAAVAGASIVEIPITFVERVAGESKLSWAIVLEGALAPWRLRCRRSALR